MYCTWVFLHCFIAQFVFNTCVNGYLGLQRKSYNQNNDKKWKNNPRKHWNCSLAVVLRSSTVGSYLKTEWSWNPLVVIWFCHDSSWNTNTVSLDPFTDLVDLIGLRGRVVIEIPFQKNRVDSDSEQFRYSTEKVFLSRNSVCLGIAHSEFGTERNEMEFGKKKF